ncbi:hypothetical protein K3495_g9751 [Podosphaera aphanis]|nr:hypothetical protein K3495_g9751 [Podosphaera aphanis]
MEHLPDQVWDVLICGTSLKHSLLALALSRSNKKILHIDANEYYGENEAAFTLPEFDKWIEEHEHDRDSSPFRNIKSWRIPFSGDSHTILSPRSYTLSLSPQIIYAKSLLLSKLVSSMAHRQLEFQAVGNWWIFDGSQEVAFKKIPTAREEIFRDRTINNTMKRRLMKFFKFVIDHERQYSAWENQGEMGLGIFLHTYFSLPSNFHPIIASLTLTLKPIEKTTVKWSLPRIARHLASTGTYGNGFGSVVARWGTGSEISQVACRACAVGGGIYMLGVDVDTTRPTDGGLKEVCLTNGYLLRTRHIVSDRENNSHARSDFVCKTVSVVSNPLKGLFGVYDIDSTLAAATIVVFPQGSLEISGGKNPSPIYVVVHSSDTGECPPGQCVLYATTLHSEFAKSTLDTSISKLLNAYSDGQGEILYSVYFEQKTTQSGCAEQSLRNSPDVDLAFNDDLLTEVEQVWHLVMENEERPGIFMKFQEREGLDTENATASND